MKRPNLDSTRRRLMFGMAGLLFARPAVAARLLQPTPQQTSGPFYPTERPLDEDNDLTRIRGRNGTAQGQATDLTGRIMDVNGQPVGDTRIEIWQCDANGRYHHPRDRADRTLDEHFQGFGQNITDVEGRYRFRTIRPVPYPGRTPHIHVAVFPRGTPPFVTQLYVKGDQRNAGDFLFKRIPVERRALVLVDFLPAPKGGTQLSAEFDIVLGGVAGTPSG